MYVYYRQCYKIMKPACVFPIEVELGITLDPSRQVSHDHDISSHDKPSLSHDTEGEHENTTVDDLLLPSLATPTDEPKPHPQSVVDDLLTLPQSSEP